VKKDKKLMVKRLEDLKQETILNYLDSINLDHPMELCDSMIQHLFAGDLDSAFASKYLLGVDQEEAREIFELARRYKDLCFYMGDPGYWADSIEGVYLTDVDLVSMKLLDNYDFLLGLSRVGGENSLKQLEAFKGSMSLNGSVIDYLRNNFDNDDILMDTIVEMSKEDGVYQGLSDEQKEVLCTFPEGILYEKKDDSIEKIPVSELVHKMQEVYFGTQSEEYNDLEKFSKLFPSKEAFEEVIISIYYPSYQNYSDEKHFK
jgi:hypothetical protein